MTTTTIRVSEPRELLAFIPYQLGFRPRASAVCVSLRSPRGRIGLVARIDLADLADPDLGAGAAASLVAHLWQDGAERAVLVLYAQGARHGTVWSREVSQAAQHFLDAAEERFEPVEVWVVDGDRYYAFGCEDTRCCPADGHPVEDLDATQVSAHMAVRGAVVAERREDLVQVAPADRAPRRNTTRVAGRWRARREEADGDAKALASWRAASLRAWSRLTTDVANGATPRPRDLGRLEVALGDSITRDAVITSFVAGDRVAQAAVQDAGARGADTTAHALGAIFDAEVGLAPGGEDLERWRSALRAVIAHGAARAQAPARTLLGVLAWWSGDGGQARAWISAALADAPGYRLATLVDAALAAGLGPGWVRRTHLDGDHLR